MSFRVGQRLECPRPDERPGTPRGSGSSYLSRSVGLGPLRRPPHPYAPSPGAAALINLPEGESG